MIAGQDMAQDKKVSSIQPLTAKEISQTCFVICPIGDAGTETRRRSDQVLRHIIEPAVEKYNFKALRADQISEPGMITSQIIQNIVESPLVIADLTERNPNVYYELAIRHAIRKPLIQMIQKGEALPFDVAGTRTIHFDHKDLDSVEEVKAEICRQIESMSGRHSDIESPISISLDLQTLRQSENPEERSLGDVLIAISEIRSGIGTLEKRLSDPSSLLPPNYLKEISRFFNKDTYLATREISIISERLINMLENQKISNKNESEVRELIHGLRKTCEVLMMRL